MTAPTVRLAGFEAALCEAVAAGFRFSGVFLGPKPLVVGRHLFAKWMPETKAIQANLQTGETFDPYREPVTAFYDNPNASGEQPSASYGGKLGFTIEVVTRLPAPGDNVTRHAAEMVEWMKDKLPGQRAGDFRIKGATIQGTPGGLVREGDGMIFASTRIRFLAVSLT